LCENRPAAGSARLQRRPLGCTLLRILIRDKCFRILIASFVRRCSQSDLELLPRRRSAFRHGTPYVRGMTVAAPNGVTLHSIFAHCHHNPPRPALIAVYDHGWVFLEINAHQPIHLDGGPGSGVSARTVAAGAGTGVPSGRIAALGPIPVGRPVLDRPDAARIGLPIELDSLCAAIERRPHPIECPSMVLGNDPLDGCAVRILALPRSRFEPHRFVFGRVCLCALRTNQNHGLAAKAERDSVDSTGSDVFLSRDGWPTSSFERRFIGSGTRHGLAVGASPDSAVHDHLARRALDDSLVP
jgi:hypothetical protein